MSEAIKIKEGGVDRSQNQIFKLKTNTVGGGVCYWIPETELATDDKSITANGTYTAEQDGLYGYSELHVSVPSSGGVSGKDPDMPGADDYVVDIDEDGYITEEKLPAYIQIMLPPVKTEYYDGEAIDTTGIVVKAYDAEGNLWEAEGYEGGVIPADDLTINPTTAEYNGTHYTDGSGANVMKITTDTTTVSYNAPPVPGYDVGAETTGYIYGEPIGHYSLNFYKRDQQSLEVIYVDEDAPIFMCSNSQTPYDYYVTRYNGKLYIAGVNGTVDWNFVQLEANRWNGHVYFYKVSASGNTGTQFVLEDYVVYPSEWIPESTVNPLTIDTSKLISEGIIEVTWNRPGDYKGLSDTFNVIVQPVETGTAHGNEGGSNEGGSDEGGFEGGGSEHGF